MTQPAPTPAGADASAAAERVLGEILHAVVELFGSTFVAEEVRVDADVFDGADELVTGRPLDSMDLVQTMAVIEDLFDVSLAPLLTGDEPLTLRAIARHVAESTGT